MLTVHANWWNAHLYLWAEIGCVHDSSAATAGARSEIMGAIELRQHLGDHWDGLLISEAEDATLTLRLPHQPGDVEGTHRLWHGSPPDETTTPQANPAQTLEIEWRDTPVAALRFAPADAYDVLQRLPAGSAGTFAVAATVHYWSKLSALVRELLAGQHFAPALHRAGAEEYRGYWRVVLPDGETTERLAGLITAMPPVCRSVVADAESVRSAALVENFLWTMVDGLVRRCLEDDELAHALFESTAAGSGQIPWLKSLVGSEAKVATPAAEARAIEEVLRTWLSALDPRSGQRACRTCIRLNPPEPDGSNQDKLLTLSWRLTFEMEALEFPDLVVEARQLWERPGEDPAILPRPFDGAREQLRADLSAAARHFTPLAPCAESDGPLTCALSLEEAYRFLRDAAPLLEAEGIPVRLPSWWHGERPRLRMVLDVRPASGGGETNDAMRLDALIDYDWMVALGEENLSLDEISQLAQSKEPLVQLRGRWVEPRPSEVTAALKFLGGSRGGRMTLFEALRMAYTADDLATGLPVGALRAHGWVERLLNAPDVNESVERLSPPKEFHGELRPYQLRGVEWFRFLARHGMGACLADDMGLGKTIQLIGLLLAEREIGDPVGPTLLVVPMSLVGNWQRELTRFGPSLKVLVHHGLERLSGETLIEQAARHDVVIMTYGLTHRDFDDLVKVRWHRVALDEAQNIKNPAAKQSLAVRSLTATHRVALTGTPVENRLSELWSIMDFLNPGYLGSAPDFRHRFAGPIERQRDTDRAQRLRHLIRPFVLRRLKSDPNIVQDLPAKLEMTVFCNLTREQAALYEALVKNMLAQIDASGGIQRRGLILAALVKLKQICNHPAHFLGDGSPLPHRSGKVERLCEMLDEALAEGDHALVFTQFRVMGHLLQPHLHQILNREILFLHGGVAQGARTQMVERFQSGKEDLPLMILSLKAGGLGLNLTAANHVFHFDRWWNPAVEDQATDRAHRIGQSRQVQVHKFVCVGTLEERIAAMIESKRALADQIIGSGEEWITELSTAALRELFALSRDAVAEE